MSLLGLNIPNPFARTPKRGTGWKPNPLDTRDREWKQTTGAGPSGAEHRSLQAFVLHLLNQGGTSSCVWQTIESAIAVRDAVRGLPYAPPSARAGYVMALAGQGEIVDEGLYPRGALSTFAKHGCPLKSQWAWNERKVLEIPPSTLLLKGYKHSGFQYEHITEIGRAKLDAITAAIAEGYPVMVALDVPPSYGSWRGQGVYAPKPGERGSGHYQLIVSLPFGSSSAILLNSWGTSVGNGGFFTVDSGWIQDKGRDIVIAKNWPRDRSEARTA